jgi:hypothetical protein
MTNFSFYFCLKEINFVDSEMGNFITVLANEMTMIVFFWGINHFSVAGV